MNKLLLLGFFCFIQAELIKENGVIQLTQKNFDDALITYEWLFVKFYAPWCGHCQQLQPIFVTAADEFQKTNKDNLNLGFAEIDCEAYPDIGDRFNITSYPTLLLFSQSQKSFTRYQGERQVEHMLIWIENQIASPLQQLNTADEILSWVERAKNYFGIIFFAISPDDPDLVTFNVYANKHKNYPFAATLDLKSREELEIKPDQKIVFYRGYGVQRNDFVGEVTEENLDRWLGDIAIPRLIPFGTIANNKLFYENEPGLIVFLNITEVKSKTALKEFQQIAENLKDTEIQFIFIDLLMDGFGELASYIGIKWNSLPAFAILDPKNNFEKYLFQDEFNEENIKKFVQAFENNSLTPHIKSQDIPEINDEPSKIVVIDTWNEIIVQSSKDVLLFIFAPWCPYCQKLHPIFDDIASALQINQNLVFAKIDATQNDITLVEFEYYPTLYFFKNGSKDQPVIFAGELEEESILNFVRQHTTFEWVVHPEKLEEYKKLQEEQQNNNQNQTNDYGEEAEEQEQYEIEIEKQDNIQIDL